MARLKAAPLLAAAAAARSRLNRVGASAAAAAAATGNATATGGPLQREPYAIEHCADWTRREAALQA